MGNGLNPLDRDLKLFPEDNSLFGNYCLNITSLIMNYIGYLRFADIFLPKITFTGFYDHADFNFPGLFLTDLTGPFTLLRPTFSFRVNHRELLVTHLKIPFSTHIAALSKMTARATLPVGGISPIDSKGQSTLIQ